MTPIAIHQFSTACSHGDGITNGMFLTQQLLQTAGICSEIYCADIDPKLADRVKPFSNYVGHENQILLIHHGIGNHLEAELKALPDQCFMVFHNITPEEMFEADDPIRPMLAHGWQQVDEWKTWLRGCIADSQQNLDHLLEYGHSDENCQVIPLLVDLEQFQSLKPEYSFRPVEEVFNLLFVGRVMPHKNQLGLIETLYHVRCMTQQDIKLTLIGNTSDEQYVSTCRNYISELGLENAVNITGKIDNERLTQYFQQSDLYVSLSHHEGFGMPLIESMAQQLPVLAYSSENSNVANTIGNAGLVLQSDDPKACAASIVQLFENPRLRAYLNKQARKHLESFTHQALYDTFRTFMAGFDVTLPAHQFPEKSSGSVRYRIEGPFDSTYSLALVNRKLAEALERRHPGEVALYSTEGHGDFAPNPAFIANNPECARMFEKGQQTAQSDIAMRLLYPPRVTGMKGIQNGLGCYGWEESALPWDYVRSFNQHLPFSTTMSSYVTQTMIDNGVNTPLFTTGIGVDHILEEEADSAELPQIPERFKLLHISSCFPRKGVDCLLEAYGKSFNGSDDVTLIIKTFPNPHHDIDAQLATWRNSLENPPHITLINRDLDAPAIRALYQHADLLVAPSRGEGFGLPMAEAMLHHLPVITTGYGGQTDFCKDNNSWLIDFEFARTDTHMGQSASVWVNPDKKHLAELLQQHHNAFLKGDYEQFTAEKLDNAYQLISTDFTWDAVAKRTDDAMSSLSEAPLLSPELKFGSVTSWNSKCGIATYSQMLLEPALADATIFANSDAELMAKDSEKVIRCWETGQGDDLQFLEREIYASGINQLLIQFNFSFFNIAALKRLLNSLHTNGVQTLITFHSTADVDTGSEIQTLRDLLPELHQCTRILVHSTQDLNRLKSWQIIDNCTLLPHGVQRHNIEALRPQQLPPALANKQVISSYGFALPHKGLRQLIEAFAMVHAKNQNTHLLLVNAEYPVDISRQEVEACQKLVCSLELTDQVTMITDFLEHEESLSWLSMADCIVFPYQNTQESASGAVRWGLATEKPVLCTPLNIFEDVQDAAHFLPGSGPDEIAKGLQGLLNNDAVARSLHDKQQSWLEQHDWDRISQRLKNLCSSIQLNQIRT